MSTPVSKRRALRFSGYNRPVRYRTDYEDGEARLLNISTNGCAIGNITAELSVDEKILLIMELADPEDQVQIQAVVVRADENGSAGLKFIRVNDELKHRILHFYANETRRRTNETATPP